LFTARRDEDRLREEFAEHLAMAAEERVRSGMPETEARRQAALDFGAVEAAKDAYRDQRSLAWLSSIAADAVFGWRQLKKHRTASGAAILSLALATGACISAFRLMDALLWRPLPVAHPEQLYALSRAGIGFDGKPAEFDGWAYPAFQRMGAAVAGDAELLAISYAERMDITYRSVQETEKASVQYVSGRMFPSFGLRAAVGRLFTEDDDRRPGAHPVAVLSHDYWSRRFGSDPGVIGRSVHIGGQVLEIIGVGPVGFDGTETGTVVDFFVPAMMHPAAVRDDSTWIRTLARVREGVAVEPIRQKLHAASRAFELERAKGFTGMTRQAIERFLDQRTVMLPAVSGASGLQQDYRRALQILGVLVVLVLLIACVNVANLMTVRAASRAREMALRVSIGAGRGRLVQMVLVESAMLACFAAAAGAAFAWWAAPFVVSQISSPDSPVRLVLPADGRVLSFSVLLTLGVMLLFGLTPALRASAVKPASALKGGEDPHAPRRSRNTLIAAQVAFCFLVLFVAGLFTTTFDRLSKRPLGFAPDGVVNLDTVAEQPQAPVVWMQAAEQLRATPGVESVAIARWPLLHNLATNSFISVDGAPPGPVLAYFLNVSPGWIGAMQIPLIDGRDFRPSDASPGAAIVNETFAGQYFDGRNPVGRRFSRGRSQYEVVGLVKDAPYRSLHEPILPVAYVPIQTVRPEGGYQPVREASLVVRARDANTRALVPLLRNAIVRARPDFRVSSSYTQNELIQAQTLRERLLAMLAFFFAGVAVLLVAIGLYGVLDYSVLQRRREIGIRLAIGAQNSGIARLVTGEALTMVFAGAAGGIALGLWLGRYIGSLLYQVKPTDWNMLVLPLVAILVAAALAALAPVLRAVRVDPVAMLRE
jgi:predicted permease